MAEKRFNTALITGASGGLGEALAKRIAQEKIALILSGREEEKLAALTASLSKQCLVENSVVDLSTAASREPLCDLIRQQVPDLVINNAGYGLYGEALSYNDLDQLGLFHVNAEAVLQLTLVAARALVAAGRRGTIVNISSAAAYNPFPLQAVYAASKAFVTSFSSSLDYELAPYGVRVLSSSPGVIQTSFALRASGNNFSAGGGVYAMEPEKVAEAIWQQITIGRKEKIIDWRYNLALQFARFFMPQNWIASFLQRSITKRIGKRPLILE